MSVSPIKTIGVLAMALIIANCDAGSFLEPDPKGGGIGDGIAEVASLTMDPVPALITEDDTVAFRVIALDSAGEPIDSVDIQWSSTDENVAHIESTGGTESTLVATSPGTTTITASYEALSTSTPVEVHKRPVDLVYVSGSGQKGDPGTQLADSLVVRVIDKRGDPVSDVQLSFSVASGGGAVSSEAGLTDGDGHLGTLWTLGDSGEQIIEARASAAQPRVKQVKDSVVVFTAELVDTTSTAEVASVTIIPDSVAVQEDSTVHLDAEVKDSSGNSVSSPSIKWTSTDTAVAAVDGNGMVTARGVGAVKVVAESGSKVDSAYVQVVPNPVATVTVDPAADTVAIGSTTQLVASVYDDSGNLLTDRTVTWSSSDTKISTVDSGGLVTGTAEGQIIVSATAEGVSDSASITVAGSAEGTLAVSPSADTLYGIGDTTTLTVEARAADGSLISDPDVQWSSQDTSIATVDSMGTVISRVLGTVVIAASAVCCSGDFSEIEVVDDTTSTPADTAAPTVPAGLSATVVSSSRIDLAWTASSDDSAVAGYHVFRDGTQVADVPDTAYSDTGLAASTTYSYQVSAYDDAGNESGLSNTVNPTTDTVATDAAVWGEHELEFTGPSGLSNPFTDANGTVTFTGPSGQQYTVDMFYDGDGAGGQSGTVWKARVMPDEAGTWSWSSSSNSTELDGHTGTFDALDRGLSGPFEVDPSYPYYLKRNTGEHAFLVGDWLFVTAAGSGKVPLNHLAPSLSDEERQTLINFHTSRGLNLYSLYLNNRNDLGHTVDPYLNSSASDHTRYDLARWHDWESKLGALRDAGLSVEFWLHSDAGFSESDAEFQDFITYAVARLGARRELVAWVIGLEVNEYWSDAQRTAFGQHLQAKDPYGKPRASHFGPGDNGDRSDPWLTYVPIQYGFTGAPTNINSRSESNRDQSKPIYAAEFAYAGTADADARRSMWVAFVSGSAMIGNGPGQTSTTSDQGMKYFADYVNGSNAPDSRPQWWEMSPADELVTSGEGYLLRDPGVRYLCFLPAGGSVDIDLTEATGELVYDWYNPRDGTVVTGGTAYGGATVTFTAPDSSDWLLDIRT